MITDEKMVELIHRTHNIVQKGFERGMQFPEQLAIASPIYATVLQALIEDAKDAMDLGSRFPRE